MAKHNSLDLIRYHADLLVLAGKKPTSVLIGWNVLEEIRAIFLSRLSEQAAKTSRFAEMTPEAFMEQLRIRTSAGVLRCAPYKSANSFKLV